MLKLTPNLHFSGQCRQAMELYSRAFGASETILLSNSQADTHDYTSPEEKRDCVYHAEMLIGGQRIMMSDSDKPTGDGHPVSLVVTFGTRREVLDAYEILSDGAEILSPIQSTTYSSCFVSLVDRFGIRWELMTEQPDR